MLSGSFTLKDFLAMLYFYFSFILEPMFLSASFSKR